MLLKHMVDMAHSVGVKICIEGIEEKEGHYELTLKRPSTIGLNELNIDINKEIKMLFLIINISIMKSLIF